MDFRSTFRVLNRMNLCKFGKLSFAICVIILQLGIFSPGSCYGQGAPITYTNFADYITNKVWVSEMTFDMSMKTNGFTSRKASLQPNGMFYQDLTNTPYRKLFVFGESKDEYWQTTATTIDIAMKSPALGGSLSNRLQMLCLNGRQMILYVLNMGIDGLDNRNIKWISQNEFVSPLLDWVGNTTSGQIDAKIDSYYGNLPAELECKVTGAYNENFYIKYKYSHAVLPPTEEDITKTVGHRVSFLTNMIRSVDFGIRDDAISGFMPSNFYLGNADGAILDFESNGAAYFIHTNGSLQLIPRSQLVYINKSAAPSLKLIRVILGVLIILPLAIFLVQLVYSKNKSNKT